ncbi:ShlB/FhaC/HecB family hemolysin secretion/activation protein [Parasphingorhabdus sp.]|uniref:ShlB/FhaC/HecB family hemolysin secretion/activation protein n=1 Tax=Parasphingorhabdus sp. TaxID=2709688 RepID=UPI003C78B453
MLNSNNFKFLYVACASILFCSAVQTYAQTTTEPSAIERTIPKKLLERSSELAVQTDLPDAEVNRALTGRFVLGAVHVSGSTVFSQSQLAADYEPYLATEVGDTQLQQIVTRITERYRSAGYFLSYAMLPAQDVRAGVVRIDVIEGRIDQFEVSGAEGGERALNSIASPLLDGRPLRTTLLERVLGLMRDLPGFYIADARIGRHENDLAEHELTVEVVRNDVRAIAYADNRGTVDDARARFYTSISHSSLMTTGDDFRLSGFAIPGSNFQYLYGQGAYVLPIGRQGWLLEFSGSYGDQKQVSFGEVTNGRSTNIAAELSYPVIRSRAFTAVAKIAVNDWFSTSVNDDAQVRRDRLRVVRVGLGLDRTLPSQINLDIWLAQGLGFNAATRPGDPISSRPDAGGKFTKVNVALQLQQPIGTDLKVRLAAAGQVSSRPLLSIEEFALGGNSIGRAYDFNALTGDHGFGGSLELAYMLGDQFGGLKQVELFSYVDGGMVFQSGDGNGPGPDQSLTSAGGGARFTLDRFRVSAEAGIPIEAIENHRSIRAFLSVSTVF